MESHPSDARLRAHGIIHPHTCPHCATEELLATLQRMAAESQLSHNDYTVIDVACSRIRARLNIFTEEELSRWTELCNLRHLYGRGKEELPR